MLEKDNTQAIAKREKNDKLKSSSRKKKQAKHEQGQTNNHDTAKRQGTRRK
jgi:hypothetical protein